MQEISASVLNLCVDFSYSFSGFFPSFTYSLCKKSVRVSLIFAWILATRFLAFSRRLLPFCFLERFFCAFLSRFNRFFNGFGASIFSPVSNVAKVAIPSQ